MILVIGAGVAGLACARAAAEGGAEVLLVTPGRLRSDGPGSPADALGGGSTALAQGGIAAAIGAGDAPGSHLTDTLAAGGGIVDREAADRLVSDGARIVSGLVSSGFPADRTASGALALGLEAAHSRPRIVHAGEDRTGAALHAFLVSELLGSPVAARIRVLEETTAEMLIVSHGAVVGARLHRRGGAADGGPESIAADAVVLATGGYSALFPRTSNPAGARGEGIVLAARAGALVADLEFVQFHPTVLDGTGHLVSEAVRGAGAVLLDAAGRRFMPDADARAELAPRDIVSRETHRVMRRQGGAPVLLDATGIETAGGPGTLARRFPAITAAVAARGFDWAREPIPVSPAAHYSMGGVLSDLVGRSTVPGLFVAGEAAATGVHGANRLASNSLLEGLVFGAAAGAEAARHAAAPPDSRGWTLRGAGVARLAAAAEVTALLPDPAPATDPRADAAAGTRVSAALDAGLGIERDAPGLAEAARAVTAERGPAAALAAMALDAAVARTESRGAHQRADFPEPDPAFATRRARIPRFPVGAAPGADPLATHADVSEPEAGRSLSSC